MHGRDRWGRGSRVAGVETLGEDLEPRLVALRSPAGVALITAAALASMVGFLDAYVVNVAVPAIGESLGASVATLQWTLTGYLVTVAALLLLSGALADGFGRRRILARSGGHAAHAAVLAPSTTPTSARPPPSTTPPRAWAA